jgi:serine/threonine-protein kinase HipA
VLLGSQAAPADVTHFLCTQLAFWFLAVTDGHARNFSVFLLPSDRYRMTPLCDVISLWPVIGKGPNHVPWPSAKLAMTIRSKSAQYTLQSIIARHWQATANKAGVAGVWDAMRYMVGLMEPALAAVQARLPADFPARTAQAVFEGVRTQLKRWQQRVLETLVDR